MRNYQKYNSRRISAKGTLPMSTDPDGRVNVCERCRRNTELYHSRDLDEYLCDECISLPRCEHCEGFMKAPGTFNEPRKEFWCDNCIKEYAETKPTLQELLALSKALVASMTEEEKTEMLRKQGEGWAKSEAQWAKDFREGKCERD